MAEDLQDAPDALLMGHIAIGRCDCVEVLVTRYERSLLSFLRRATGGAAEADDLFQETWIRVVRSARTYDPTYRFSTWLFRIAWNQVRTYWAQRKNGPRLENDVRLDEQPHAGASMDQDVLDRERATLMASLVRQLPPRLAEAIWLRYFEELTEKQMASHLGVPAGTVKSRLHHGLKQLTMLLEGRLS
jgi:RNA polymerase sigma-70 factor (ECF subfamily)